MFGTVARMMIKPGSAAAFDELVERFEARHVEGWRSTNIYRSTANPDEIWLSVVFTDEASYRRNADDPKTDAWSKELRAYLAGPPDWHDGEVIHSSHGH